MFALWKKTLLGSGRENVQVIVELSAARTHEEMSELRWSVNCGCAFAWRSLRGRLSQPQPNCQ
jgi:hypothetical protein